MLALCVNGLAFCGALGHEKRCTAFGFVGKQMQVYNWTCTRITLSQPRGASKGQLLLCRTLLSRLAF
jgi:hypothetical protein